MKGKCIVFTRPETVDFAEIDIRDPERGQLVTKTLITGVSTGTESRVFRGKQDGAEFPLIPGYENLSTVVAAGEGTKTPIGATVFVREHLYDSPGFSRSWGSQVSDSLTTESSVISIPDGVPPEKAIYVKVSGIALHGVKRARIAPGESVAVVGLGIIGHLVLQHALEAGARVIAIDMVPERLELAKQAGSDTIINAGETDVAQSVIAATDGGVDAAFDATGQADTLELTAALLRPRPWDTDISRTSRLVIQGTLEEPMSIQYLALFMPELDVIVPRDCDTQDMIDALTSMESGNTNPGIIPAATFSYREAPTAYRKLLQRELMRVVFEWE